MNKNYIYILLVGILLLVAIIFIKKDTKTFKIDGIKYAVSVDGVAETSFPSKDSYTVNINCSNANGSWNYQEWVAEISNITGSVSCNISFTSTTKVTFNNYIKNLLGTNISVLQESTTGNGSTLEKITENGEEDYRYRGINPANYVKFNNELWRIIGVFDDNTHGITDTHLVKIIRNDSIGAYVWDNDTSVSNYGNNNFPNSDIYNILNTAYYNHINATGADYCYASQASLPGKCNFTRNGIQTEYQSMIESGVNWFLGGYSDVNVTRSAMYGYERSSTKYSSNYITTKDAGLTVPVGLMYISDYGYAAPSTCTSNLGSYNTVGCADQNWIKSNYFECTITHFSSNSYQVSNVHREGYLEIYYANYGYDTRPTLYLKSNVYYLSGTGTQADPYIIAQ